MNPYQKIAESTLNLLKTLEKKDQRDALALVLATAATKAVDALRARAQAATLKIEFEIGQGDLSEDFTKNNVALALGHNILGNPNVVLVEKERDMTKAVFTVQCALFAREDWK